MDDFASAHLLGLLTTRGWLVTYRRAPAAEAEAPAAGAEAPPAGATVTLEEGVYAVVLRARSHSRVVPPLIHCTPGSLTYSVPLFLERQCDLVVTLGGAALARARLPPALLVRLSGFSGP